jgi:hypothetical protein
MAADDDPCHHVPDKPEITAQNESAVAWSSVANPSHAATAAIIEADPKPVYTRAELTSGGNVKNPSQHPFPADLCEPVR